MWAALQEEGGKSRKVTAYLCLEKQEQTEEKPVPKKEAGSRNVTNATKASGMQASGPGVVGVVVILHGRSSRPLPAACQPITITLTEVAWPKWLPRVLPL